MENQYVFYEWKAIRSKVEKLTEKKKSDLRSFEQMIVFTLLSEEIYLLHLKLCWNNQNLAHLDGPF